jgi:hypothetical protein
VSFGWQAAGRISTALRLFAIPAALGSSLACAPANPSRDSVVGKWKIEWTCGGEALDLKPDGTYEYTVDFAAGGRATDAGRWELAPMHGPTRS